MPCDRCSRAQTVRLMQQKLVEEHQFCTQYARKVLAAVRRLCSLAHLRISARDGCGHWHVLGLFGRAKAKVEESTVRGVTQKDLIDLILRLDLRLVLPSALSGPPLKWLAAFNLCAQHKAQVLWRLCGDDGCGGCL